MDVTSCSRFTNLFGQTAVMEFINLDNFTRIVMCISKYINLSRFFPSLFLILHQQEQSTITPHDSHPVVIHCPNPTVANKVTTRPYILSRPVDMKKCQIHHSHLNVILTNENLNLFVHFHPIEIVLEKLTFCLFKNKS